jgi:hypothetical protein
LGDAQLQSTENALMLSMYWKDRLDRGRLFFRYIEGEERCPSSKGPHDPI